MGYDSFSVGIGISGEKEFKNALREINNSFKVLGSELNLISSQFDKNDKSIEAITARNRVLNREIDTQKEKIDTLEKALHNAATSFGDADKRTQAWQVQLNNAKAELNNMQKELKQNDTALNNVADEFNDAEKQSEQFNKALKKTADTADHSGGSFSKLGSVLGKIGVGLGAGVLAIGTAAVGAAAGLAKMSITAAENADQIQTTAEVYGLSAERVQELTYVGTKLDVELETITKAQTKVTKAMFESKDGTGATADAFKQLGISVVGSDGKLRDSKVVMGEALTALGKMRNETERDALAMKLFGKSAMEMNPLIKAGGAEIAKLTEEAHKTGAVLSNEAIESLDKFGDSFEALKLSAKGIAGELSVGLLPVLNDVVSFAQKIMPEISGAIKTGDFTKLGEVLASGLSEALTKALIMINKLIPIVLNIVGSMGKVILDNLPMIIDAAVNIVMTLFQGIISALPQLAQGATQLVLALLDGIIGNLPALVEGALLMIVTLAKGIAEALPELIPKIVDAVILIVQVLIDNMDLILDAALQIILGLAQGLLAALPRLIEALPQLIISIVTFITDNLPMIIDVAVQIIVMLAFGLIQAIPQLLAKLPEILAAIVGGLLKIIPMIMNIGNQIIAGLWEGMKSMFPNFTKGIEDFFSGVVDGIKNLLGIKSPSRVFAGIGENMGAGLGEGFLSAMSGVEKNMQSAIPTNFDIRASLNGLQPAFAGMPNQAVSYNHTGTIRVEGINTKGELSGVVDIIIEELRKEVRR